MTHSGVLMVLLALVCALRASTPIMMWTDMALGEGWKAGTELATPVDVKQLSAVLKDILQKPVRPPLILSLSPLPYTRSKASQRQKWSTTFSLSRSIRPSSRYAVSRPHIVRHPELCLLSCLH